MGADYTPEKHTAEGNEHADDDRWQSRASDIFGLLEHETHDDGWRGGFNLLSREKRLYDEPRESRIVKLINCKELVCRQ